MAHSSNMELPTLAEFKALLEEEKLFRDYFNAFLNLPIFAKRLTYNSSTNKFIIEPRVKSRYHSVNENGVWLWVLTTRLPLFWGSDLHLEYRLSQCLAESAPPVGDERCSVSLMDRFRRFLCQTEGESLWLFWKDTERLKLTKDKQFVQRVFHHIQSTYLQDSAPFALPKCVREKAVLCARKELSLRGSVGRVELLFSAQSLALEELLKYWTVRYNVHQENSQSLTRDSSNISKTFSQEVNSEKAGSAHLTLLPCIVYEEGRISDHHRPEKAPHIQLRDLSLPSLVSTGAVGVKKMAGTGGDRVEQLITPSTHHLLPEKEDYSTHSSSLLQDLPTLPYMTASLRADTLSGHPFLLYLTQQARPVAPHLLFWQSVEILLAQDEMKRWVKRNPSARWDQMVFFEEHPVARDLRQLVELFLRTRSLYRVELPVRVHRRELCALVEKGLGHNILLAAQEHSTKILYTHWQAYLFSDHKSFMDNCTSKKVLRHGIQRALRLECTPSPDELVTMVFDSSALAGAWRALKHAEAAKYHGIHFLPSRSSPPTLSLAPPTDTEEYILDLMEIDAPLMLEGVALTPMVTTICDQLLYDWEQSKVKRNLLYTTTHTYDTTKRPQIPGTITEVLKDRDQLEFFRHYLFMQGTNAETPLQFWMAVEDLKTSMDSQRAFNTKLRRIQERFFVGRGGNSPLNIHPVFYELSKSNKPSILQLIAAQVEVVKSLEKNWFTDYVAHLNAKKDEEVEKEEERKSACRASTKGLWGMFAHNVISFRRGLMNSVTAKQFRDFLRNEAIRGNAGHNKKLVGTKVVYVTKLLNDLSFWAEVERYKDLVDMIRAGKDKGTYTPEDEIMIHKKAHAIVNCYIDSAVSPRVQINIPQDLVTYILDNLSQGLITRGLFHEAALNIFSVLILFWKRFCVHRFAPRERRHSTMTRGRAGSSLYHPEERRQSHIPHTHLFWDGGPTLSFNLTAGLRWHYPPNYHLLLQQEQANTGRNSLFITA